MDTISSCFWPRPRIKITYVPVSSVSRNKVPIPERLFVTFHHQRSTLNSAHKMKSSLILSFLSFAVPTRSQNPGPYSDVSSMNDTLLSNATGSFDPTIGADSGAAQSQYVADVTAQLLDAGLSSSSTAAEDNSVGSQLDHLLPVDDTAVKIPSRADALSRLKRKVCYHVTNHLCGAVRDGLSQFNGATLKDNEDT